MRYGQDVAWLLSQAVSGPWNRIPAERMSGACAQQAGEHDM